MITLKKRKWYSLAIAIVFFFTIVLELNLSMINVKAASETLTFSSSTRYAWDLTSTMYSLTKDCVTDNENMNGTITSSNVLGDKQLQIFASNSDPYNAIPNSQNLYYSSDWSKNDSGDQSGILFGDSINTVDKYTQLIIKMADNSKFCLESFWALDYKRILNDMNMPLGFKAYGYTNGVSGEHYHTDFYFGSLGNNYKICGTPEFKNVDMVVITRLNGPPYDNYLDLVLNNIVVTPPTVAPAAPKIEGVAAKTGTDDHYTNIKPFILKGTGEPGSIVTIYDDSNDKYSSPVTVDKDGKWQASINLPPDDDDDENYTIYAQATISGTGLYSDKSEYFELHYDITPPTVSDVADGVVYTSEVTPNFPHDVSAELKKDGVSDSTYKRGDTISADGSYELTLTDKAGNKTVVKFTIDTTAPSILSIVRNDTPVTNVDTVQYTVTFSKSVKNVSADDFNLITTGNVLCGEVNVASSSSTVYTVTVKGISEDGTLKLAIKETNDITDEIDHALNTNYTVTGTETYTIDNTPIVITNINDNDVLTVSSITPKFDSTPESVILKKGADNVAYTVGNAISGSGSYTLTATDKAGNITTVKFTLPKSSENKITLFKIGTVVGTINNNSHTIAITVPYGTDITKLTPKIELSNSATVPPDSNVETDFTSPVIYTVTAEDSTKQDYTVTVTVASKVTTPTTTSSENTTLKPAESANNPFNNADSYSASPNNNANTTTAAVTTTAETKPEPKIGGTSGWAKLEEKILKANTGETIPIDMNGTTSVPQSILSDIKGKDVKVELDFGTYSWEINGKDITSAQSVDLGVTYTPSVISPDLVDGVAGNAPSIQLQLNYNGSFGFTGKLTVKLPPEMAGQYANLYYYNPETKKLELYASALIGADGTATFDFTHASDYVVVMEKAPKSSNLAAGESATDSAKPITESGMPYAIIAAVVAVGMIIYKQKRKNK